MLTGSFSTIEVMHLTGATARQLQWWDEHRLIVPLRRGRKRLYSPSDLAEILVILELRRRHISLQQIRRVLRFLKKQFHARLADLVSDQAEHPLTDYHLLIDGNRLYLETDAQQIFDLLKNAEQAVFLISLSTAVKKLRVARVSETDAAIPKKPSGKVATKEGASERSA
ncbi:Putative transcriptional regulator [Acidisarcina polymorpha]|uniref:Transcriptional regulator n=1 Tax=Acidisarcina polymorpha TaxID=2211140 RepID=A0A2Z5G0C9_9BACT|nr:MerR family transcriptional regulator [Acidisarcina polymorpha]AXC12552.1 Putative transcriptional regulator [Acidisarcina polymorpha]